MCYWQSYQILPAEFTIENESVCTVYMCVRKQNRKNKLEEQKIQIFCQLLVLLHFPNKNITSNIFKLLKKMIEINVENKLKCTKVESWRMQFNLMYIAICSLIRWHQNVNMKHKLYFLPIKPSCFWMKMWLRLKF